jgi:hypothetical protein
MYKKSKILVEIQRLVQSGKLKKEFTVADINNVSKIIKSSPSFLSKHCEKNSGEYSEYFKRIKRGLYSLK